MDGSQLDKTLVGLCEHQDNGSGFIRVSGWIAWSDQSAISGPVDIRIGDDPPFRIKALAYRPDIELRGVVGGLCGFSAFVRKETTLSHPLEVHASVENGPEYPLTLSPEVVRPFHPEGGFIEGPPAAISGWLLDPQTWLKNIPPELFIDGQVRIPILTWSEAEAIQITAVGNFAQSRGRYTKHRFTVKILDILRYVQEHYDVKELYIGPNIFDGKTHSVTLVSSGHELDKQDFILPIIKSKTTLSKKRTVGDRNTSPFATIAPAEDVSANVGNRNASPLVTIAPDKRIPASAINKSAPKIFDTQNTAAQQIPTFDKGRVNDIDKVKELIKRDRLFDHTWYARRYKINSTNSDDLLDDFIHEGAGRWGRNPNALFDADFYAKTYMQNEASSVSPFLHYLTEGVKNASWPHPLIDGPFVAHQLAVLNITDNILGALLHKCVAYSLNPHPVFSTNYYNNRYPELRRHRVHPIIHFFERGDLEKRSPHPLFWPDFFARDKAVAGSSGGHLLSYMRSMDLFGVDPNPYFDVEEYRNRHPELKHANINMLYHYLRFGRFEGRSPNREMDLEWIAREYSRQLAITNLDPLSFLLIYNRRYLRANPEGRPLAVSPKHARSPGEDLQSSGSTTSSRARPRKVVFLSHSLKVQGAQTSLFELAVGMKRYFGHDVHVLAPDQGPMKEKYRAEGVPVHTYRLPVAGLADEITYGGLLREFESLIVDLNPDIVHGNTVQAYHALAIAARRGIPTLWNIRESEDPTSHGADYHPLAANLLREALGARHQFVFVSGATKDLWENAFPGISAAAIHNGIDYNRLSLNFRSVNRTAARAAYNLRDEDIVLLNVGTWTERKGQRDVVQALTKIDRRLWPNIRLMLIGANDTPYGKEIHADIQNAPRALRERIDVYGETNGLAERAKVLLAYAAADIFVFTSRIESYPRVINEAMFYGLPIAATPCFGVVEQLEADVSTKFYQFGATDQLAAILQRMIVDKDMRHNLGEAARAAAFNRVIQYDDMLSRYNATYEKMMG